MNLEKAIEIAVQAHKGVKDKAGNAYILHPIAIMNSLETEEEKIVGILHDVVEDSAWTFEKLKEEGFSDRIISGVRSVTKASEDLDYFAFINRAKANDIGRKVKIADLNHNLDVTRLKELTHQDLLRINKYLKALEILTEEEH